MLDKKLHKIFQNLSLLLNIMCHFELFKDSYIVRAYLHTTKLKGQREFEVVLTYLVMQSISMETFFGNKLNEEE